MVGRLAQTTHEDKLQGRLDYLCERTIETVVEYRGKPLAEIMELTQEEQEMAQFMKYRQGVLDALKCGTQRISKLQRGVQGAVAIEDKSFEKWKRSGKAYSMDVWKEMVKKEPKLAGKAKPVEKKMRDGAIITMVKVYNDPVGVMDFEEGEETNAVNTTIIDDGTLQLTDTQLADGYKSTSQALFGDVKQASTRTDEQGP